MDVCADQYRFATALHVLSMLKHAYNIIIDNGVVVPVHGIEVVCGLNDTGKRLLWMLMTNVQLPGAESYDSQISIHNSTANTDMSLVRDFQKHISDLTQAHGLLYHIKWINFSSKRKWADS